MKIGLDARTTQGSFTGDATYWRELIEGLSRLDQEDDIKLYLFPKLAEPQFTLSRPLEKRYLQARNWRTWSLFSFPRALKSDGIELAHVQYSIPPSMPCPVVTTIHDVSFKRYPEFFTFMDRTILDMAVKRAGKAAARILTVSEFQKSEIVELYGISPDKITATHLAAGEQFKPVDRDQARSQLKEEYGIDKNFVLSVGVIQPRKNLQRLLEGYAKLDKEIRSSHKLVIVGKYGWKESGFPKKIEELGLVDDVVLPGHVPYEELPVFYSAAELFVYPSVYEGFGLPPLEAMACGTPVVTGNRSSLPEVVGNAGIMVDPYDPAEFTNAITKVLSDESLRTEMSRKGLAQAKNFSWTKMAEQVLQVYRNIR